MIANAIREERAITPAAEWLVDNFHVVDEQLREIRDDLPAGFYRELPKLAEGPLAGYPRVYGIAWAFVAHTDSRFDPEIAPSLRARLPARAAADDRRAVGGGDHATRRARGEPPAPGREHRSRARGATGGRRAGRRAARRRRRRGRGAGRRGASRASRAAPLVTAFAVQLVQRLREQDRAVTPALRWLDQRLAAQGTTSDDIVRVEHQRQAAMNVTVRNVILSMSLMSALDWTEFFEGVSLVDEVLRGGPRLRRDGFRDPRRLPARDRRAGAGLGPLRAGRRARGHGARARVARRQRGRPAAQIPASI